MKTVTLCILWRPQYERIRTFAEIPIEVVLNERVPSYQAIAEEAWDLRQQGYTRNEIIKTLNISHQTLNLAVKWIKSSGDRADIVKRGGKRKK